MVWSVKYLERLVASDSATLLARRKCLNWGNRWKKRNLLSASEQDMDSDAEGIIK